MLWMLCVGTLVGLAAGAVLGGLVANARARAALEPSLREAEARARAAQAAGDARVEELRRAAAAQLGEARRAAEEQAVEARRAAEERIADLRRGLEEQKALVDDARTRLGETFKALSAEALKQSQEDFLALAAREIAVARETADAQMEARQKAIESMVNPVRESLAKVDQQIQTIEKERGVAYGTLTEQVRALAATQEKLRDETGNLVKALRAPAVRGRWGEMQLRRVVELAGMLEHCDFVQQATVATEDGHIRPDMIVRLPGGRNLVVDAKTPLAAYLDAQEAKEDADRTARLRDHAMQVRSHVAKLAAKSYWEQFSDSSPEFVVMFLPGETFYSAALEQMPSLIEEAVAQRVILATPTTLIALLQAVAFGWRQERLAESAQRISDHGRMLHERVATLVDHFNKLGASLGKSVEHFNSAMASFETRVVPSARKFEELGAGSKKDLAAPVRLDGRPRLVARVADDTPASGSTAAPPPAQAALPSFER